MSKRRIRTEPGKGDLAGAPAGAAVKPLFTVAVGASAGGLEALERFFEPFPADASDLTFVVVQHLSPDHKSLMVDLLSKRTRLAVVQAEDGQPLTGGTIHVLPPGKLIAVQGGRLRLTDKPPAGGLSLPIDGFLNALAKDQAERAVAVILSGTGSDGARGVRSIHEQGGAVLVQAPETARFDGMPRSAIDTGVVDQVLPPEDMADRLLGYARQAPLGRVAAQAVLEPPGDELQRIIAAVESRTGMDFSHYRPGTLHRRIERRMHLNQVDGMADYLSLVSGSQIEAAALRKELLIGVTAFFRDPKAFNDLRAHVIPDLLERAGPGGKVRVWVCGCATGEEAYSVAMLFAEAQTSLQQPPEVKIFATDIDRQALDHAGAGLYPESLVADIAPDLRERHFQRMGDHFKVSAALRRMITFASHNVIKDPPFTRLDLVCCRNLLIYFEPTLQQAVLGRFRFALRTGGALFLGSSETLAGMAKDFAVISGRHRLFRLIAQGRLPLMLEPRKDRPGNAARVLAPVGGTSGLPTLDGPVQALLDACSPPGLLVNSNMQVVHNFAGAERYLRVPTGAVTHEIARYLAPPLATLLPAAVSRVFREWREAHMTGVAVELPAGPQALDVRLCPVDLGGAAGRHVAVLLQAADDRVVGPMSMDLDRAVRDRIQLLEQELQASLSDQQTFVEEVETANEELQATNEELLASNEELQSTNEELQSVNEELHTVNAELKEKVEELTRLNDDLDNLTAVAGVGIIFVDSEGAVRRFSPPASKVVNLMERDLGRRIFDLTTRLDYPDFGSHIAQVLGGGDPIEIEAQAADGSIYMVRMLPYRSEQSRLTGAVITFTDVTRLIEAEKRLQVYIDALPHQVAVVDAQGIIVLVNEAWRRFAESNGGPADRCGVGINYLDVCVAAGSDGGPVAEAVAAGLRRVLSGESDHFAVEYPCHSPDEFRWFLMNVAPIGRGVGGSVVSHVNITERKRSEDGLRLAASVFESSGESILITDGQERIISVNPAFVETTGYEPAEVLGQTPRILSSGQHGSDFYCQMWSELTQRGRWSGEVWNRRKNGEIFPEWLTISRVVDLQGDPTHYVAVFSDMTERKAAERRLMDINAELEQFAYVASHDLREPLRMVSSYLSLIERQMGANLAGDLAEFLNFARDGARRMDRLILDLLEFSRIGRLSNPTVRISLAELLDRALADMALRIEETGAEIETSGAAALVRVSEDDVTRLFDNLISNALKYRNPEVRPRIRITCRADRGRVTVSVADNGIGIPPEQRERVFRMFQRLHGREDYGGGTGIGLAICKKIIERHGGSITLDDSPLGGARFVFSLPS